MKNIYLLAGILFFLLCDVAAHAKQTVIYGRFPISSSVGIKLYLPINGWFNGMVFDYPPDTEQMFQNGRFYYKFSLAQPAFVEVCITNKSMPVNTISVLLVPGDSVGIVLNLEGPEDKAISFEGNNAAGHFLHQQLRNDRFKFFAPIITLQKGLPETKTILISKAEHYLSSLINSFKELYQRNAISAPFYKSVSDEMRLLIYQELVRRFVGPAPSAAIASLDDEFKDSVIRYIYKDFDPYRKDLRGLTGYRGYCNVFYIDKAIRAGIEIEVNDSLWFRDDTSFKVDKLLKQFILIENRELQEDLWAMYLGNIFRFVPGYFRNEASIDQFAALFPGSVYIPFLKIACNKSNEGLRENASRKLLQPVQIVDSLGTFNSVTELVSKLFRHKSVYVDVWASWCGPCISEFSFNDRVDSFLLANKIERLYISIDNKSNLSAWSKSINDNKLGGKHVLAGDQLKADLNQILNNADDRPLSIPRYFIIDERGRIVIKDALRPSDGELLWEQLKTFLN